MSYELRAASGEPRAELLAIGVWLQAALPADSS